MILNEEKRDVTVSGDFESTSYSIEAGAKAFAVLSKNIYVNAVKAVIRELSTNAMDIHTEVGNQDVPFKVHLPTTIEAWFGIRDFGTGLSKEAAMKTYTTYFYSTRADSNKYTGALGLGSKSPFAVADSFTVTSWFEGVKYVYTAYKDENQCPQFALLTEEKSDEPSGLEVVVHVEGMEAEFIREAVQVYKHFEIMPDINIPSVVATIKDQLNAMQLVGKDFRLSHKYGRMVAVMGSVGYEIPSQLVDFSSDGILYFELGELNFNPGREQLTLDDKTRTAIKDRYQKIKDEAVEMIFKTIDEEDTAWKRRKAFHRFEKGTLGSWLSNSQRRYDYKYTGHHSFATMSKYGRVVKKGVDRTLPMGEDVHYFLNQPGCTHRVRYFVRNEHVTAVLLTQSQAEDIEIDAEDLQNPMNLPKPPRSARATQSQLKTYTWNGQTSNRTPSDSWEPTVVDLDEDERVYVCINRWKLDGSRYYSVNYMRRAIEAAAKFGVHLNYDEVHGLKNVYVNGKKFEKGNWITVHDYLKREVKECIKERTFVKYNGYYEDLFKAIAEAGGPEEFSDFVELHEQIDTETPSVLREYDIEVAFDESLDTMEELLLEKYPMLKFTKHAGAADMVTILNYVQGENE
jgi:hypothetical protein